MFIKKKRDDEEDYPSWSSDDQEETHGHSMWSREIKRLLKKLGLC